MPLPQGPVTNRFWPRLIQSRPRDDLQPFATTFSGIFQNDLPKIDYINNSKWAQIQKALAEPFTDLFVNFAGMSRIGSVILVHAYGGRNPGVYVLLDTGKMQLKPLFQSKPWINLDKIGPCTPICFKNREGIELGGYLTLPASVAAKNLPMVLIAHGGEYQRGPIQNTEELHKPFEWRVYSKEGHGFYTQLHRSACYKKMQTFLKKYLGPGTLPENQASQATQ